jgi:hypothetical protein
MYLDWFPVLVEFNLLPGNNYIPPKVYVKSVKISQQLEITLKIHKIFLYVT